MAIFHAFAVLTICTLRLLTVLKEIFSPYTFQKGDKTVCPVESIASLGEGSRGCGGAGLGTFRTFVRFVLVWFCWFPLTLGVWEGLRFVIVALPGLFSYYYFFPYVIQTFRREAKL